MCFNWIIHTNYDYNLFDVHQESFETGYWLQNNLLQFVGCVWNLEKLFCK